MFRGMYVLPDRSIRIDENASVADLLVVIDHLAAEMEWWKKERYAAAARSAAILRVGLDWPPR